MNRKENANGHAEAARAAPARLLRLLSAEQSATAMLVASRAAHEIGNPAAAIKSNLVFLAEVWPGLSARLGQMAPALRGELDEIRQVVAETSAAVDALLARLVGLRGLDAGWSRAGAIDVAALVRELSRLVQAAVEQRAGRVRFTLALPERVFAAGAEDALALIVTRVLWLACEESLGPREEEEVELRVWVHRESSHVRLGVEYRGLDVGTEGERGGPEHPAPGGAHAMHSQGWAGVAHLVQKRGHELAPTVAVAALRDLVERVGGVLHVLEPSAKQPGRSGFELVLPAAGA